VSFGSVVFCEVDVFVRIWVLMRCVSVVIVVFCWVDVFARMWVEM
jgi:hypothetical protein